MEKVNVSIFQLLDGIPFFAGFSHEELGRLMDAGEWSKVAPSERIITEGEMDLSMYVLVQGSVDVVLNNRVLSVLNAGDTFGEFGVMGERRTAHVVARTECLLLGFDSDRLNALDLNLQIRFLKRIVFTMFARLQKINRRTWWDLPTQWR